MNTIKIWGDNPSEKQLADITSVLEQGGLVIIPTDSVYAIICDALNAKAIDRLCRLKGIDPQKNTLSILCADISMAAEYSTIDNASFKLIKEHSPAPVTYILKAGRTLPKTLKNRKEIGIRLPDLNTPREIARYLGHPVLSTTIELDDEDYLREPDLIAERYDGRVDMMVDGGEGEAQLSTIVNLQDGIEIVREGKYHFPV